MLDDVLLLDIGNTKLKWASLKGETFIPGDVLKHSGQLEYEMLTQVGQDLSPDYVVASSVAGSKNELILQEWAQQRFQADIQFVKALPQEHGVINAYTDPTQLGSDRWAAVIAAHHGWQDNLCVIDAGTALTLDLLRSDGHHLGGYILPGLRLMQHCLLEGTEIPISTDSVILASDSKVGDNTISCITNGALQATCGLVERSVTQFQQQCNDKVQCILTGSDSQRLADNLTIPNVIEPDLVLRGLGYIARGRLVNK